MRGIWGWVGLLAVLLGGAAFAAANAGRLVIIDLGIVTLYQVPVTFVAFGGMVVGMGVMLLAGIRSDLKVRALLRQRKGTLSGGSPPPPGTEAYPAVASDSVDSTAESRMPPSHLSAPPPEVPESWDRSRQSELPIE